MALHSPKYHLLPADLRKPPTECLKPILHRAVPPFQTPIIDPSVPTLLLFECVLAYMSPESSSSLLSWFVSEAGSVLGCIVYEMFGLNDAFGRVMLSNLKVSNSTQRLRLIKYPPATQHCDTWNRTIPRRSQSNKEVYNNRVYSGSSSHIEGHPEVVYRARGTRKVSQASTFADKSTKLECRVSKVEFLDEIEELELVLAHYAISWGLYVRDSEAAKDWGSWGLKQKVGGQ